ncbi:1-acyl-sn-glycerol-3-phosphate acyltransferase 3 isoform X2 [Cannabis sativa]|uniref:1-acyl-sn-glycerol-3-phosphate acyltransferase 3 isoform X2 n=1 Tax=Cannabis sativa TaxID=3483 RepID=UPI0029CA38FD|nr:1-acyl-sn-glycerol-3-phosphate acyltransferase 3 isoform X2 [Cannabis sativa]
MQWYGNESSKRISLSLPTILIQTLSLSLSLSLSLYISLGHSFCRSRSGSEARLEMAVPASLVILPIGILFLFSGLIVNIFQAFFFVLVRPLSKNMYRRINKVIAELLWLELIWLIDWWAAIEIIGWSMWFCDYVFLERNWAKDESILKSGFQRLEDFPMPFWLALFVEGTRFTQQKLAVAQHYATARGLPVPKNVLIPRTKGFVSAVSHMRSFVPAIYDCTVAIPTNQSPPTLLRMFGGKPSVVKVQIRRHLMHEIPETEDGMAQWCRDVFVTKDALLEKYFTKGKFTDLEHQKINRPKKSLIVVTCWSCLVVYGIVKLIQWSSLLSSWQGITYFGAFLVLVTFTMQILIQSSESERSTPVGLPSQDPMRQAFIQNYAENQIFDNTS